MNEIEHCLCGAAVPVDQQSLRAFTEPHVIRGCKACKYTGAKPAPKLGAAIVQSGDAGRLIDYRTGDFIRCATADEQSASREAAKRDGGRGVIAVGGRSCYVEE